MDETELFHVTLTASALADGETALRAAKAAATREGGERITAELVDEGAAQITFAIRTESESAADAAADAVLAAIPGDYRWTKFVARGWRSS